jgi:RNA polymerase II subunit A C-terminal domain phosphatase
MSEQTDVTLPSNLPYPIKITKCRVSNGDSIRRGSPLFDYSFKYKPVDQPKVETRYGTWESPLEGTINFWNIETGDEVSMDYGPVLVVTEPCKHGLQIAGMCANCGKDMTEFVFDSVTLFKSSFILIRVDYLSNGASERAKIKMDHSGEGPLMSVEEAARIERENTDHLLRNRKLSLIVDLDQTILHATVDPTVGEWMKAKRSSENGSTTPPMESANWPALADVVQFQLGDDHHGTTSVPHPSSPWYYIKPRYAPD